MTSDIIELNDFIVLIETTDAQEAETAKCGFDDDVIGITFYGSGDVLLEIESDTVQTQLNCQKGMGFSFFGNDRIELSRKISSSAPLREVSIFATVESIQKLPEQEKELYTHHLNNLLSPGKDFELGPQILMTPEMQTAISKIFSSSLQNANRLLFLKSQVIELLSHYFAQISTSEPQSIRQEEINKIHEARDIIIDNINQPPSLSELSQLIGMNNNKLKKNFKQIFGMPVFKYLQNQRLQKAYHLLDRKEMTVQEVAWFVGYESLSSFSNAFRKQYGFRPSEVSK